MRTLYGGVRRRVTDPETLLGASLVAWWRASDLSDGAVSSWADAIGGLALAQATGDAQPVKAATSFNHAYAGVTADGTDDYLRVEATTGLPTGSDAGEIWVVAQVQSTSGNRTPFRYGGLANDTFRTLRVQATTGQARATTSALSAGAESAGSVLGLHILQGGFSGTQATGRVSGTESAAGTIAALNTSTTRTTLFGTNANTPTEFAQAVVSDVMVVNGLLSLSQRQALEGWIAVNRGLRHRLPFHHPYRFAV